MKSHLSSVKRFIAFIVIFAVFSQSVSASIWNVDTNADTDPNTCVANEADNDDDCTFRDAVSQLVAGDTIRFLENETITNTSSATNPYTITQNTVTVDGQTGGYTIQVDGGGLGSGSSYSLLKASGTDYTQKGLYMYNYNGNLVELSPTATSANVNNNVLGLNSVGGGTGANQAALKTSARNVTVQSNVLSNSGKGLFITAATTYADTAVKGNRIGVDGVLSAGVLQSSGGITDKGNTGQGIDVQGGNFTGDGSGVEGLTIGGPDAADRNIISGNESQGIWVRNTASTSGNITIQNNYIGVGSDGSTQVANGTSSSSAAGILGDDHANLATVNWTIKDNVISGNTALSGTAPGIRALSGGTVTIQGNIIGFKAGGTTALANTGAGIEVDAGTVTIGTNND